MPDRKGMVSGFIVAGFGAGAAVFDMVATAVVNPGNASPDPKTGYYGKVNKIAMLCCARRSLSLCAKSRLGGFGSGCPNRLRRGNSLGDFTSDSGRFVWG